MDLRKIGKFIAKNRQEKNYTQESLAEELDVSNRAVSKWERGICLPDAGAFVKGSKCLGIIILLPAWNGKRLHVPIWKNT